MTEKGMDMQWVRVSEAQENILLSRFGHTAVTVDANEYWGTDLVVMFGGVSPRTAADDKHTALSDVVVLQSDTDSWFAPEVSGEGPGPRAFHCSCSVNRKVYIFGGHVMTYDPDQNKRRKNFFQDLWELDTDTWSWSLVNYQDEAPLPPRRDMASMVHIGYGKLLLFGGRSDSTRALGDLWIFDTGKMEWSPVKVSGPSPSPRKMHSMALSAGRVVLFGGEKDSGGLLDDLWLLKGLDGVEVPRWTPVKVRPSPQPRFGHAAAVSGSRMAVFGGCLDLTSFLSLSRNYVQCSELWILDTNTFTWTKVELEGGEQPSERMCHTLTALPGGRALLVGGRGANRIYPDVWWLNVEGEIPAPPSAATSPTTYQPPTITPSAPSDIPYSPTAPLPAGQSASTPPSKGSALMATPAGPSPSSSAPSLLQALLQPLKPNRVSRDGEPMGTADKLEDSTQPSATTSTEPSHTGALAPSPSGAKKAEEPSLLQMQPLDMAGRLVADTQQRLRRVADVGSSAMDRLSTTVTSLLPQGLQPRLLPSSSSRGSLSGDRREGAASPSLSSPLLHTPGVAAIKFNSFDEASVPAVEAAADAAAMEELRGSLGLPAVPHRPRPSPPTSLQTAANTQAALVWLGQRLPTPLTPPPPTTTSPAPSSEDALIASARHYLCSHPPDSLPLRHVEVMLRDYQHLAAATISQTLQQHLLQQIQITQQQQPPQSAPAGACTSAPDAAAADSTTSPLVGFSGITAPGSGTSTQQMEAVGDVDGQPVSSKDVPAVSWRVDVDGYWFQSTRMQELRLRDIDALAQEYRQMLAASGYVAAGA